MRLAARRDDNEILIINALLRAGASVRPVSSPGCADLLVGYKGRTFLIEVKGELGAGGGKSHRELTPAQIKWQDGWLGSPVHVVRTAAEAVAVICKGDA